MGGGKSHPVKGSVTAIVKTESRPIKLKMVEYVPSMTKNLIFVGAITDIGQQVIFSNCQCWIVDENGCIVASGRRDPSNKLYCFRDATHALITNNGDFTML